MLETLGLDSLSERVYRAMLAEPPVGLGELAVRLAITEAELRTALDRLSALALVRRRGGQGAGFHTVNPEVAMELLLARQQAELAAQQQRLEASRAAAAQLIAECSILGSPQPTTESERLLGADAIRERLAELGETAEEAVMTFAPGGAHTEEDLRASRGPNAALFDRGVQMRTIYLDSIRNDQPTLDHVAWLNSRGGRVRTAPSLPTRMIIIDRRLAVLPLDTSDARAGAVILTGATVVSALCALFESVWAGAVPLGDSACPDRHGLAPQEAETLRMLAEGMTDEAIAKRLGVSPRTARRIAAELMERLDARSRFQAGVHAVQDGWLPPGR
ncbi:LuxR family transcriptional regulator [Kitasatospora atroaurantiaca]|uniref:Regulatory LuxR family protein n=2 Tax=Kitasatospora atroaurantiaca TaxID=285545 RepID=A0A561ERH9_9ACTN|nr:LuxR C-terminal-related transcriptional regulator [Kitasatospora atroaurantiaca]TWE18216.1 regulatory LuxR family protein [Kitasatospora atroaurantiaca]